MSLDLERLLRDTLENRAATVTTGPRWTVPAPRRQRWVAPLAAAAAVAGIAAAAVLVPSGHHTQTPPVSDRPTVQTTTPAPDELHAATCTTSLPAAWQSVIAAGILPASTGTLTPLAMTSRGNLLATRTNNGHDQLLVVGPDRSVKAVYTAPTGRISLAAGNDRWVMAYSGAAGGAGPAIEAVDRVTGAAIAVRSASTRTDAIVQPPVLLDDTVYWTEGDSSGVGSVYAFDLAHRTTRILDHGALSRPVAFGGGLYWLKSTTAGAKSGRLITHVPGTLPPQFQVQPWSGYADLVQDGRVYAWGGYVLQSGNPQYAFRVWADGAAPVTVFPPSQAGAGEVPVLSMPYLFARSRVVDLNTGASAPITTGVRLAADGFLVVQAGDRLSVVRTADLPAPRC